MNYITTGLKNKVLLSKKVRAIKILQTRDGQNKSVLNQFAKNIRSKASLASD